MWANFQRILEVLPKNLLLSSPKKNMGLGSEFRKNLFQIPDPGPGVKKGTRSRSATLFGIPYPDKQQPARDDPFLQYTSGIWMLWPFV